MIHMLSQSIFKTRYLVIAASFAPICAIAQISPQQTQQFSPQQLQQLQQQPRGINTIQPVNPAPVNPTQVQGFVPVNPTQQLAALNSQVAQLTQALTALNGQMTQQAATNKSTQDGINWLRTQLYKSSPTAPQGVTYGGRTGGFSNAEGTCLPEAKVNGRCP